jgi:hypothetical protein
LFSDQARIFKRDVGHQGGIFSQARLTHRDSLVFLTEGQLAALDSFAALIGRNGNFRRLATESGVLRPQIGA